jgi:quinol monooxygenase YgiN
MPRKTCAVLAVLMVGLTVRSLWPIPARGDDADESVCVVTHVDVIPPMTDAGRTLLKGFAAESRKDAGAIRVEVFEDLGRPNHSTVVEIWKNRKAYDDHLAVDHVKTYRAKLQPMLGSPFDERLHRQVR